MKNSFGYYFVQGQRTDGFIKALPGRCAVRKLGTIISSTSPTKLASISPLKSLSLMNEKD